MQKVLGIGGIFFKARDPARLSEWYAKHLGVGLPPAAEGDSEWQQQAGPTVFAPMSADSEHFKKDAQLYINFRVEDLAVMCEQLQAAGIEITVDPEEYSYGKFASLEDPEGNQIQLWQAVDV